MGAITERGEKVDQKPLLTGKKYHIIIDINADMPVKSIAILLLQSISQPALRGAGEIYG